MTARKPDPARLDAIVARARAESEARQRGYRERALKLYPWVCGRCGRSFDRSNLHELTVHHRNHDHDDNPEDGSNWELLCLYCHDNEHQRQQALGADADEEVDAAKHTPFAGLGDALRRRDPP